MFDKLKNLFKKAEAQPEQTVEKPVKEPKPGVKKPKPVAPELTPKEQATADGEPFVTILKVDIDPNDINNGSFDLDWNDKFVINLIKAGYKIKAEDTDADIVDRWFTQVCRNVVLEVYEQDQADPDTRAQMRVIQTKDIGNGRTEVS